MGTAYFCRRFGMWALQRTVHGTAPDNWWVLMSLRLRRFAAFRLCSCCRACLPHLTVINDRSVQVHLQGAKYSRSVSRPQGLNLLCVFCSLCGAHQQEPAHPYAKPEQCRLMPSLLENLSECYFTVLPIMCYAIAGPFT
jgi:hypothetical protein